MVGGGYGEVLGFDWVEGVCLDFVDFVFEVIGVGEVVELNIDVVVFWLGWGVYVELFVV